MNRILVLAAALTLAACGQQAAKAPADPSGMAGMDSMSAPAPAEAGPIESVGAITVSQGWAPVTPAGARVAAGYIAVSNAGGEADALIAVESPRAKSVEIHEMVKDGDMMSMRRMPALEIPAGGEVQLAPGGTHLMFFDPAGAFADGELITVTLTFKKAGKLDVKLLVRPRDAAADSSHDAH
jgi:copper(I)-binding protein